MQSAFYKICWASLLFILSSCAHQPSSHSNVTLGDRKTLAFTGKGAAAGMMMDAYLGGTGVAIGIAIDEGIAKDIEKNLSQRPGGFDMLRLVSTELRSNKYNQHTAGIAIDTYGFKTYPGEGDKVTAWLKIRCGGKNGEVILNYPEDFVDPKTIELSEAKGNPDLAFDLLRNATDRALEVAFSVKMKK